MGRRVAFLVIGMMAILTIATTFMAVMAVKSAYAYSTIDDGWTVETSDATYEDVTLTKLNTIGMRDVRKGDELTLTRTLPATQEVPFPAIAYKTRYSALEVFCDDELIYMFRMEEYARGDFIGSKQHFILLPRGSEGGTLTIKLYVDRDKAFYYIRKPAFGNYDDIVQMYLHDNILPLVSGIYLTVFGVLFFVISLIFFMRVKEMRVTLVSAFLCVTLAVWMMTRDDLLSFFFRVRERTIVEYTSLYMLMPLLVLMVYMTHNYTSKKVFFLYTAPLLLVSVWNFLGAAAGLFPIYAYRNLFYGASAIVVLAFFAETYRCFQNRLETVDQIQMVSISLFNIFLALEFIVYYPAQHYAAVDGKIGGLMLPAGGLLFSLGQVMNFFVFVTRAYVQRAESASLRRMAYLDILTGLPNRASYDREMRSLDEDGARYCIISLDLNGLKETNDTLGHAAGDALLSSFGATLQEVFDVGFCSRIGGDEFVVILRGASRENSKKDVEQRLALLEEKLHALDLKETRVLHSAAYGYAFSEERLGARAHDIFLLADNRMYDKKRKQHALFRPATEREELLGDAGLKWKEDIDTKEDNEAKKDSTTDEETND